MTGLLSELLEVLRLGATVPFAEGVNVVDVANNDAGLARKLIRQQALEKSGAREPAMHIRHANRDVMAELELVSPLKISTVRNSPAQS